MLFGGHVRTTGGMVTAVARAEAMGFDVAQVFTQSPRAWRERGGDPDSFVAYRNAQAACRRLRATYCHATYLINLASPDADIRERSARCLANNLRVATAIGADGLVLHAGSHRGAGLESCVQGVAQQLLECLTDDLVACPIVLENTAGGGGTIGRDVDELAQLLDAVGDERFGVCIDSQHLWASGVDFATPDRMDAFVRELDGVIGLDRVRCLHLNDSKVERGSGRDRHANLGAGSIGRRGLAAFVGHPRLQELPVVLEMEGIEGHGPGPKDVALARRLHKQGLDLYD